MEGIVDILPQHTSWVERLDGPVTTPVPFTSKEYYDAAKAYEAELAAHNCRDPNPRYTPHPAYEKFSSKAAELGKWKVNFLHFVEAS